MARLNQDRSTSEQQRAGVCFEPDGRPLVQLPLPDQKVRLAMQGQSVLLGDLSKKSLLIELRDCPKQ